MRALEKERQQARELGRQINHEARRNPNSPYAGKVIGILRGEVVMVADTLDEVAKVIGILRGEVVMVADTLDEVAAVLERLESDAQRRYCIDASADYDAQYTIWMQGSCQE